MRYSQQRRGGSGVSDSNPATSSLQEMYAEGIDPSLCSGPPSAPPFQNQMSSSRLSHGGPGGHTTVTQSMAGNFMGPNQAILNYGPQFPVTSGLPLTAIPNMGATITTGVGMPIMPTDPMLLAAAHGPDSFTDVRGGVTYFNPTAQNFMPQRPSVNKRPKAAIAIVDPSSTGRESMEGELAPELVAEQ